MIASRLNMISSPPPPQLRRKNADFFSSSSAGICCIITGEILLAEVYSLQRLDMSQVRLDGYMLRILQRRA